MRIGRSTVFGLLSAAMLAPLAAAAWHRPFVVAAVEPPTMAKPPTGYETRPVEGWQVLINSEFLKSQPDLAERVLKLLGFQLFQVSRVVPAAALETLKTIKIWVEENEPHHPCMAYHPDPAWLREHGMSTRKARCVEIANARNFLQWTHEQPWMVLHELSHAYHHQFLKGGFRNAEVKAAYEHAVKAKLYDRVLRYNGREEKAYATTNPMEYFAEASEAYFGANDFFPFVKIELRRHDPMAYETLEKLWGVAPPVATKTAATGKSSSGRTRAETKSKTRGRG